MSTSTSTHNVRTVTPAAYGHGTAWVGDALLSFYFCSLVLMVFLVSTPEMRHWFVVPVLACGTIIGVDAVRVVIGKLSAFEPVGFVGLIGFHFFFLAPLLHVRFDLWMRFVDSPSDWRDWLGRMAVLNLLGLVAYVTTRAVVLRINTENHSRVEWRLNERRFRDIVAMALVATALLQIVIYQRFGGISGYINSFEEGTGSFENLGIIFSFSESFPILAMMAFAIWAKDRPNSTDWRFWVGVIAVYLVLVVLFGGLRGSRGNVVWAIFWAVGLIHVWIRPVPRKLLVAGAIFLVMFMYLYGFYKTLGLDAFTIATSSEEGIGAVEDASGRTLEGLLLGDLARSDVQAFLAYQLSPKPQGIDYEYARGRSYVGGLSLVIPRWIWPDRPSTKTVYGTDAQYGAGAHETRPKLSSRAYGLAGEGMLNFGPLAVPFLYGVYGVLVGIAQRWVSNLSRTDSRLLIAPFITILAFYFLVWDSDNILVFIFKRGAIPIILVALASIIAKQNANQVSWRSRST